MILLTYLRLVLWQLRLPLKLLIKFQKYLVEGAYTSHQSSQLVRHYLKIVNKFKHKFYSRPFGVVQLSVVGLLHALNGVASSILAESTLIYLVSFVYRKYRRIGLCFLLFYLKIPRGFLYESGVYIDVFKFNFDNCSGNKFKKK